MAGNMKRDMRDFVKKRKRLYAIALVFVNAAGAANRGAKTFLSRKILKEPDRIEVAQKTLERINGKTYLEIGVSFGESFKAVQAERKIGVDPVPPAQDVLDNLDSNTRFFEMTSDEFFQTAAEKAFGGRGVDVVLIDGLHEYGQVLRDVKNCLKYLNGNGVIIMHDCNPWSEAVATPAMSYEEARDKAHGQGLDWTGSWTGDVWKGIVCLRTMKDVSVFVLNCDCGLGIVTKGKPESVLDYSAEDIKKMDYHDLDNDRKNFLNLKNASYFSSFLEQLNGYNGAKK
jgi:hypothetical protein